MSLLGQLEQHGFILDGQNASIYDGQLMVKDGIVSGVTANSVSTAGAATYTIAQMLDGVILRDPAGGDRSDVSPTATLIVNGIKNPQVGSSVRFKIRNSADADEVITLTAGSGVTLSGKMTINRGETREFIAVITATGTPAVTIYDAGVSGGLYHVHFEISDISGANVGYSVCPHPGRLIKVSTVLYNAITVADATITIASSVGDVAETITITQSGSAAGDVDVIEPAVHANTVIGKDTFIKGTSDGGSTTAARLGLMATIEKD